MSYSQDERQLKQVLNEIINSTAGLKYAIILDDTGITIVHDSKFTFSNDNPISVEKIGAIGGAVFTAGEEQGFILDYGNINLQITEYDKGMLFSMKVGKGVLCIITDKKVQIGYLKAIMKKYSPRISTILSRYLKADQDQEIKDELKELFSSDTVSLL